MQTFRSDTTHWMLVQGVELVTRECEDGILVFDGTRNQTHLINVKAWDLLCSLRNSTIPLDKEISVLVDRTASVIQAKENELFDVLEKIGLLKRC